MNHYLSDSNGSSGNRGGGPILPGTLVEARKSQLAGNRNEITLQELWHGVVKRRITFFACFAVATLIGLGASLTLPKRYEALGRLTVAFDSPGSFQVNGLAQMAGGEDPETKLQTQVNILRTDALAWDVIQRLRLDKRPEAAPHKFLIGPSVCLSSATQSPETISPECRNTLLDEFHSRLHVQLVPRTEIIEIRFRSRSRELAAQVVNTLAEIYVDKNFQAKYQAAVRSSGWLAGQLDDVKRSAEEAEQKFLTYEKKNGVIPDENHNVLVERLNAIDQQLVTAKANRIMREARYRVAMNGDADSLSEVTPASLLQQLREHEALLKIQYAQLTAKYGDDYPRVAEVKAQLDQASRATRQEAERARDNIKNEYDGALKAESLLAAEFEKQRLDAYAKNEAAIQVALLKRDVDANRELYEQLVRRLKEAGVVAGLKAANVMVIDPAQIPVQPVEPRPAQNLALGMLLGALGGLALCFVQENLDTTIKSPEDFSQFGSLASLGIVPRLSDSGAVGRMLASSNRGGTTKVAALEAPESAVADAYRSLRTALLLSSAGAPPKVVLVTSPLPREGKTTTSVNAAVVFAQKNRRVLLVDGDLRRGDLRRCFDLPRTGGLSAALIGQDPGEFYVPHPELPELKILPAGPRPPKPPDLLDSDRMRGLVEQWRRDFDHVIIDAPPLIGLSDSVILATMVDVVVLVLRAQQSHTRDLCRAQQILASVDANVGGAIINDFSLKNAAPYGYDFTSYTEYFGDNGNGRKNGHGRN